MNEEVLGGLKSALERGESLKRAMMTLFNSGYKRGEIEEAAAILTEPNIESPSKQPMNAVSKNVIVKTFEKEMPKPIAQPAISEGDSQSIQKASRYGEKNPKNNAIAFVLVSLLIFFSGLLITIFFFKQDLINFFSSIFG